MKTVLLWIFLLSPSIVSYSQVVVIGTADLSSDEWRLEFIPRHEGNSITTKNKALERARKSLITKGHIFFDGTNYSMGNNETYWKYVAQQHNTDKAT